MKRRRVRAEKAIGNLEMKRKLKVSEMAEGKQKKMKAS